MRTIKLWTLIIISFGQAHNLQADISNSTEAIKLLSPAEHIPNPTGFIKQPADAQELQKEQLRIQQLDALKYLRIHKVTEATPIVISYLDYAYTPGLVDPAHGANLNNVKNNWIAFGALIDIPNSEPVVESYCLSQANPMGFRLAALHALKYIDESAFEKCWSVLNSSSNLSEKAKAYLNYINTPRAQYDGIPEI